MQDVGIILFLIFLEGVLSFDNAMVLAICVRHLPEEQRRRALTYGIGGAFLFRALSLLFLAHLMSLSWVKFVGGAYLLYIGAKHFLCPGKNTLHDKNTTFKGFWQTVFTVELLDIAFSVDSILAAVALSPQYWVVFTGGVLGILMMRVAATGFGRLLERFPRFETSAYLLIVLIGTKLIAQGFGADFHSFSVNTALFWGLSLVSVLIGFRRKRAVQS